MSEQKPGQEPTESVSPTEEEVQDFYANLISFIKENTVHVEPGKGVVGRMLSVQGFHFMHRTPPDYLPEEPTTDHYQSINIRTAFEREDGTESRPALQISTESYLCSEKDKHAPSDIPPNTLIRLSLAGLGECFVTNGTLEGTGLSDLRDPGKINNPATKESFSKYKMYFDNASLHPPHAPIISPF